MNDDDHITKAIRTFRCASCQRVTSWDLGWADEESEICDDCWEAMQQGCLPHVTMELLSLRHCIEPSDTDADEVSRVAVKCPGCRRTCVVCSRPESCCRIRSDRRSWWEN